MLPRATCFRLRASRVAPILPAPITPRRSLGSAGGASVKRGRSALVLELVAVAVGGRVGNAVVVGGDRGDLRGAAGDVDSPVAKTIVVARGNILQRQKTWDKTPIRT